MNVSRPKRFKMKLSASWLMALLISQLVFLSIVGGRATGVFQPLELTVYDFMRWFQGFNKAPDSRITSIWLTDEDQRQMGWPIPDQVLAEMFEILESHSPKVIGLDLYRDLPVPSKDGSSHYARLEKLFKENANIIGITKIADSRGAYVAPPPALTGTDQIGFNDVLSDEGIIRRGLLFMDNGTQYYEYFGLRLALRFLEDKGISLQPVDEKQPELVGLGKSILFPMDKTFGGYAKLDAAGYQFMLDYPGAPTPFPSYTLSEILSKQFAPESIKDKIIIIGTNAEGTPDFFYTPYSRWFGGDQRMPGAAIHAYGVSQLLRLALEGVPLLRSLSPTEELFWIEAWAVTGGILSLWMSSLWRLFFMTFAGGVLAVFLGYVAFAYYLWLPVVPSLLSWLLTIILMISYHSVRERKQKGYIKDIFGYYLSPNIVEVLVNEPSKLKLGGEKREMTAFFSDIQGFSTISENLNPEELVDWINVYLTEMCQIIARYDGTVDKFIGDAIVAFWNAPLIQEDHAKLACFASLEMQTRLQELRPQWQQKGYPLINVRIGLNTGPMVVGNMGAAKRMDYTVMGDAVNLASRLEGINKFYKTYLIISEYTYEKVEAFVDVRKLDTIQVVGKNEPVTIYQLLDRKNGVSGIRAEMVESYQRGFEFYQNWNFSAALICFEAALKLDPDDGPSSVFAKRCRDYIQNPPFKGWDGVHRHTQKG
ncbi:CHASE2 domain-containing protein [Deltaproteobacteria bacterium TL4]